MAQWVKSLLGREEMLSSDPQRPSKLAVTPVMSAQGSGEVDPRASVTASIKPKWQVPGSVRARVQNVR